MEGDCFSPSKEDSLSLVDLVKILLHCKTWHRWQNINSTHSRHTFDASNLTWKPWWPHRFCVSLQQLPSFCHLLQLSSQWRWQQSTSRFPHVSEQVRKIQMYWLHWRLLLWMSTANERRSQSVMGVIILFNLWPHQGLHFFTYIPADFVPWKL